MIRLLTILFLLLGSILSVSHAKQPTKIYRGSWQSQSTGHQGPMRLRLTEKRDGTYNARFSGRFFKVVPFTYRVTMAPECGGDDCYMTLTATKQIPIFGSFRTTANVTPASVQAAYHASRDRGSFTMSRIR